MYCKDEISEISQQFDVKEAKKLQLESLLGLIEKLEEKGIEDEKADAMLLEIKDVLKKTKQEFKGNRSAFSSKFNKLMDHVRKEHKLVGKDYYSGIYLTTGIAIGVAIGAALMSSLGTAYMGAGLAIGIALGVSIGGIMDKKAKDAGLQY